MAASIHSDRQITRYNNITYFLTGEPDSSKTEGIRSYSGESAT
jgi:hypothetical protein